MSAKENEQKIKELEKTVEQQGKLIESLAMYAFGILPEEIGKIIKKSPMRYGSNQMSSMCLSEQFNALKRELQNLEDSYRQHNHSYQIKGASKGEKHTVFTSRPGVRN